MPPSLFAAPANRVPLSAYAGRPHPSRPAGAGYGGQDSDLYAWARQVVEKVRVASVGGRLRFLPWFDPYTDETPDMRREYRTMLRESSVKAAFQTKILSVISEDIQFQPEDDNDPREQEGAAFCSYAFTHLKGGTRALGWSVLHPAVIDGHSVCEKVWDEHLLSRGRFKGKRIYHAVKAKDSHYLQLGIDPYRNVTALRGTGFNAGRVWSPSDFVIFSYFSLFENPAGMSDFRAAYRPYWIKDTSWKLRSLHLQQWTGPYLRGTYATQEQKAALEDAFNNAASSTWLTIPAGVLVEAVDLSMRGTSDFKDAIADCDREILIAIVGAHLQILEGQTGGARGNTKVHKEIGELIQWWLAATLADTYQAQLVVPLMAENYHDVEPPRVTVGAITDEDMLQRAKVYQALQQVGLKLSQKAVYRAVSIQPPDPNDPDDTLEPPGGGGGPKPPGPGEGGGEGSPFAGFAEGDFHGPEAPGPGWVQVGTGPHGGKIWRKQKGKDADALARPSKPTPGKRIKEARKKNDEAWVRGQQAAASYQRALDLIPAGQVEVRALLAQAKVAAQTESYGRARALAQQALLKTFEATGGGEAFAQVSAALGAAHLAREASREAQRHLVAAYRMKRKARGHSEGGGEGQSPFGEPRRFCQEGENAGKPGPCPEGTDDAPHATSGAAARRHLTAGAPRVTLPGGAAVHVAPHPAGGHVAFLRHPDGSGRSGHPRPSRAAAVADAQTLAVGHLKGKPPVGIPLPAAPDAAPDPAGALAATVSRLFPGARPAGPGEYQIAVPGGRELSLAAAPESGSVRIDFGNAPESGLGQQDVPAALRAGSLELARTLKAVAGSLAASGTRVSFGAVPRKQGVYARVLSSLGFTRESSRPADDAIEPGQVEEVWAPPHR